MAEYDDHDEDSAAGEFEENLKKFEEMQAGGPPHFFDADELEEIIDYYLQWLNYDMAKKAIDFGMERFPFSSVIKIRYAQYLSSQHYTHEALAILNEVEELEKGNFELYMARGYIYSQMGLGEQAIENFKSAIPLAEKKDEVYVALGVEMLILLKVFIIMGVCVSAARAPAREAGAKVYFENNIGPMGT